MNKIKSRIPKSVTLGNHGVNISHGVKIGKNVKIGSFVTIREGVIIGPNVTIADNVILGCNSVIKKNTIINNSVVIRANVIIGKGCCVGDKEFIYDHSTPGICNVRVKRGVRVGKLCIINNNVLICKDVSIGNMCIIEPNVTIPRGDVIASWRYVCRHTTPRSTLTYSNEPIKYLPTDAVGKSMLYKCNLVDKLLYQLNNP